MLIEKFKNMKLKLAIIAGAAIVGMVSCTKLETKLQSSFLYTPGGGNNNITALLNGTYNDLNGLLNGQDQIFSLEENTSDECLVPTRGGDWDDNGVWRVLHAHTWTATHGQFQSVYSTV